MLSKLSRFLTIATLTTITCLITHPSNAKIVEIENINNEIYSSLKVEKVDQAREGMIEELNNKSLCMTKNPADSSRNQMNHDSLLWYAIVTDYYRQNQG